MVRLFYFFMIGTCLGIVIGQKLMTYAYDPDWLEKNSLAFCAEANYSGCISAGGNREKCYPIADKYYQDMKSIWHDKVWRKY